MSKGKNIAFCAMLVSATVCEPLEAIELEKDDLVAAVQDCSTAILARNPDIASGSYWKNDGVYLLGRGKNLYLERLGGNEVLYPRRFNLTGVGLSYSWKRRGRSYTGNYECEMDDRVRVIRVERAIGGWPSEPFP